MNTPGDAKEKAEQLLLRASSSTSAKQRVQLAEAALSLNPDSVDAYLVLAEEATEEQEARSYLKKGMEAGRRELGEKVFEQDKGHFWAISETRPYIRICLSYAESCWFGGSGGEAAKTLEHILELNPADNTGARHLLLAAYLYTNRLNDADKLLVEYGQEDNSASFAYDRIVLEYKKNGITSQLKMLHRVARNVNKHVPDYLLGVKRLPHNLPEFIGVGDMNEAVHYVVMNSRLWASMPELLKWMLKQ